MAFDKTKPAGTTPLKTSDDQIRANNEALETAIGQDHDFATGSTQTGKHKQVIFKAPITKPSLAADEGALFTKTVSTKSELVYEDEDGNEVPITSGGKLAAVVGSAKAVLRIIKVRLEYFNSSYSRITITSIYNGDTLEATNVADTSTYYTFNVTGNCLGVLGLFVTSRTGSGAGAAEPYAYVSSNDMIIRFMSGDFEGNLPLNNSIEFTISYLTDA
jgi:hypothetical protein